MIDIHSHILPELDDGSRSLEESLEMARIAAEDGITHMVATPHMFNGLSHNPEPAEVIERVGALQDAIGEGLAILPGNEVHIAHDLVEKVRDGKVTRINRKNYMLVEFPSMNVPVGADDLFYRLQTEGTTPILVHPERNSEIQRQPAVLAKFVERGTLVQVTAMSLTGEFGARARLCVERLLRHNCVHVVATDTHRAGRRPPVMSAGRDAAAAIVGDDAAGRLVDANPRAIIEGRPLQVSAPVGFNEPKQPFLSRFFPDRD